MGCHISLLCLLGEGGEATGGSRFGATRRARGVWPTARARGFAAATETGFGWEAHARGHWTWQGAPWL